MKRSGPHLRKAPVSNADSAFDELLVVTAQSGDRRGFDRLHKRWNARLARAAFRYTGDVDTARDLTQECWLAVWKGMSQLREPKHFRAYLFSVLHRRGADYVRKAIRGRQNNAIQDVDAEPAQPPRQGERSALIEAFASLPAEQRLAAHLHFVEGFTLAEIAAVQSVPPGTAKTRLFHARRKLKAALTDNPEGEP